MTLILLIALTCSTAALAARPTINVRIAERITAAWNCQSLLGIPRSTAYDPWKPHSAGFRRAQLNLWTNNLNKCRARLHDRAAALRTGRYDQLPDHDLYALANQAVSSGAIYSHRWGDASPALKGLCYEAVRRAFSRYGTQEWARHIVNRESGCNPGAINTTYSSWNQRAQCIAQMIPAYHRWVDYGRCKRDLRYAVEVFVGLSDGGKSTGPWSM